MNLWLRRFAFVGLAATVIDIGSAVLLIQIGPNTLFTYSTLDFRVLGVLWVVLKRV